MKQYRIALILLVAFVFAFTACKGKGPQLKLAKDSFAPNEMITVVYTALPEYESDAWIGIIPADIAHGSEAENDRYDLTYQYLRKSTSGEMKFRAPGTPGSYDFRMHDTDGNGREVASVTFAVLVSKEGQKVPAGTLKFKKGDAVMVEWKGSWWPAKIVAIRQGKKPYKIHYDGYSNSWDEWIGDKRIKKK